MFAYIGYAVVAFLCLWLFVKFVKLVAEIGLKLTLLSPIYIFAVLWRQFKNRRK